MVQLWNLPEQPSASNQIGKAIGQGLAGGIQRGSEIGLSDYMDQIKQQREMVNRQQIQGQSAVKLADQLFGPGQSEQKQTLVSALANLSPDQQVKGVSQMMEAQILNQYLQQNQQQQQQTPQQQGQEGNQQSQSLDQQQDIPAIGRLAPLALQQNEKKKADAKEKQFAHSHTEKYFNKLTEDSEQAGEMKYGLKLIKDAIRSGKTGPSARNLAQKYLEHSKSPLADLFATPESGKLNVGIKSLAGGFKKIMGSKPTEREFFWYENILPGLVKNMETNEAIVDYFDKLSDFPTKSIEAADQIIKENNGYRPIDIDVKVREKMKPIFNHIIGEGLSLLGETEEKPTKKDQKKQTTFTDFPDAKSYANRVLRDPDSNKRYKSDGTQWIEVK